MKIKRKFARRPLQLHRTNGANKLCLICLRWHENSKNNELTTDDENDYQADIDPLSNSGMSDQPDSSNSNYVPPRNKTQKKNLYLRFLLVLSRCLQIRTKKLHKVATENENCLQLPFCQECYNIVEKLCDLYDEWHKVKLNLCWRLSQIGETIKLSKNRVSGKLSHGLLKSLSTQLLATSSNAVDILRKQTAIKCSLKFASISPSVSINRNSCLLAMKPKLKFPVHHMQQYLMSLIAVFALAVPPKTVKKPSAVVAGINKKHKVPIIKTEKLSDETAVNKLVKIEAGAEQIFETSETTHMDFENSCPVSGPNSPANDYNTDGENNNENEEHHASDSDWSNTAAGAGNRSDSGSDVEFKLSAFVSRRWNLRKRKTRYHADGKQDADDDDTLETPDLPPLRGPRRLQQRRNINEAERVFSCNLCSRRFTLERTLKRHLGQAHAFLMQFNCAKCNLKFRKHKDLVLHTKKVHGRGPNFKAGDQLPYMGVSTPCTVCQKVFPSKVKMMFHRKIHKILQTKHTCKICGKEVTGKFRFEFHLKTHTRLDKPFRCTKCPRSFCTNDGLAAHTKIHTDKPDWVPWVRTKKKKSEVVPRDVIYKCEVPDCNKSFYKKSNLTVHMSLHENSFPCETCSKVFLLPRDLRRHLNKQHETVQKSHYCVHCDKAFTVPQTYDLHRKTVHPSKAKLCCDDDYCTEEFDTTVQLREHLKVHLTDDVAENKPANSSVLENAINAIIPPEAILENAILGAVSENKTLPENDVGTTDTRLSQNSSISDPSTVAENSVIKTENASVKAELPTVISSELECTKLGIYTCERCDWSFSRKLHLVLHQLIHTPRNERNMYQCKLCDKAFAVVDSLQTHYNRFHGPKIKPYLCLQCGARFHRKESFVPHLRMHKDQASSSSFDCGTCKHKSKDSLSLKKHIKTHKTDFQRKCDQCEESFSTKFELMNHQHSVHGLEKPFKCDAEGCDKSFFSFYQLNDHKICHTEGTFLCPLCPKVFRRSHNLNDHILVHKQEKNHICDFCGKAFVKKSSLNLHLAIHRGDKKYSCPHCDKAFCRKFARDCHVRTHTKEKPFTCDICGRGFGQYTSLKNHLKVHEKLNSSIVVRRPFKTSIGAGQPLHPPVDVGTVKQLDQGESTNVDSMDEKIFKASTDIVHEALQATLDNLNVDLETTIKPDHGSSTLSNELGDAESKIEVDSDDDEFVEEAQVKRKRGRQPTKSFTCQVCSKKFVREKPYNAHVKKHIDEETIKKGVDFGRANTSSSSTSKQGPTRKSRRDTDAVIPLSDNSLIRTGDVSSYNVRFSNNNPINIDQSQINYENESNAGSQDSHQQHYVDLSHQSADSNSGRSSLGLEQSAQNDIRPTTAHSNIGTAAFLTPFLQSNPYAIQRQRVQNDQHMQRPGNELHTLEHQRLATQQNYASIPPQQLFNQGQGQSSTALYESNKAHYQNFLQQLPRTTSSIMPQDMSKSSYSMFYANPR